MIVGFPSFGCCSSILTHYFVSLSSIDRSILYHQSPINPAGIWKVHEKATLYANELISAMLNGKGNGVEVIEMTNWLQVSEGTSPFIISCVAQRNLWKEVLSITSNPNTNVLVTGSPGIGKSRSMAYLLKELLSLGKTVVYEAAKEGNIFVFKVKRGSVDGDGDMVIGDGIGMNNLEYEVMSKYGAAIDAVELEDANNFYLIDPGEDSAEPKLVNAHTIMASSPNSSRYKGFAEKLDRTTTLYMSLWERSELEVMCRILSLGITSEVFESRFYFVGGRPRYVLNDENYTKAVENSRNDVQSMNSGMLENVILGKISDLSSDNRKLNLPSSDVCGYMSTTPFKRANRTVVFVSDFVNELVTKKFGDTLLSKYDLLPPVLKGFVKTLL